MKTNSRIAWRICPRKGIFSLTAAAIPQTVFSHPRALFTFSMPRLPMVSDPTEPSIPEKHTRWLCRATVRENGLKGLKTLLQEHYFGDGFLGDRQETMLEALMRSVRRGKSSEQVLALQAIRAAFVQVRMDLCAAGVSHDPTLTAIGVTV